MGTSPLDRIGTAVDQVDDSGYLAGIIDEVSAEYGVDPDRVDVLGASNGGFMSYRMACDHADRIAAIASISGATWLDPNRCAASEPVSVLEVHGTADEYIGYDGGVFIAAPFPSAPQTVADWAAVDGCDPEPVESEEPIDIESSLPGAETTVSDFRGCDSGAAVQLWTVDGGTHVLDHNDAFIPQVIDFLLDHPKQSAPS